MSTAKLSARELEIAGLIWQCFKTDPTIDYVKLAQVAGFKNSNTASAVWGPIKKKLVAGAAGAAGASASTTTPKKGGKSTGKANGETPSKSTGRKRSAANANANDESPTKKGRNSKKEPAAEEEQFYGDNIKVDTDGVKQEQIDSDEDEFADPVTIGALEGLEEYATGDHDGDISGYGLHPAYS